MEGFTFKELADLLKHAGPFGFSLLAALAIVMHLRSDRARDMETPPYVATVMARIDALRDDVRQEIAKARHDAEKREALQHQIVGLLHQIKAVVDMIVARKG